jgi:hypothetical protein
LWSHFKVPTCYKQDKWGVSELVTELEDCWGSVVVSCCCEKLLSEVWDSLGTQRKGNVRHSKPLPSNGSEYMTVDTSVVVIVNCKV